MGCRASSTISRRCGRSRIVARRPSRSRSASRALGCGGSGNKSPTPSTRRPTRRTPATASGAATGMPGDTLRLRRRLSERLLRRRRLLQHAPAPETCKSCNVAGIAGHLHVRPRGRRAARADRSARAADASTCGLDGTCDGSGGCRKHVAGTLCKPGTCDGDAVVGVNVCDGQGRCKAGPTTICAPFNCDQHDGACFGDLHVQRRLRQRHRLRERQLRPQAERRRVHARTATARPASAPTASAATSPASGACVSCNLMGRDGTCWPLDAGAADPRGVCHDQGPATVRADRLLRRHRRLLDVRRRDRLRRAVLQRRPAEHGRHVQRPRHLPPAGRAGLRALPLQRRRLHRPLRQRRRLRHRPRLRQTAAAARSRTASPAPRGANASATSASTASAATRRAPAPAAAAPCRRRWAAARRSRAAPPIRAASA